MNPGFESLQPYPFEKLAALKDGAPMQSKKPPIDLSKGEPKHAPPEFILKAIEENLALASVYPATRGLEELRHTIAMWLTNRFSLPHNSITTQHVLPVNGTREALFAIAQCLIDRNKPAPIVIMPNPFYQIYEGAALLAGATPFYMNMDAGNDFKPDVKSIHKDIWRCCELLYLCSPNNPAGSVIGLDTIEPLFKLADEYGFVIAADECYSEIYLHEDNPPLGLLEAAAKLGRDDYQRCIVFHSLSKRSNVPGLRSGFVAGDPAIMETFLKYRTYHGCAMPLHTQHASIAAWGDEEHVRENRRLYRQKCATVLNILQPVFDVRKPQATFYLWPQIPISDTDFARRLYTQQNLTVLPGSFLSREANGENPGKRRLRMALIAPEDDCADAARRMVECAHNL